MKPSIFDREPELIAIGSSCCIVASVYFITQDRGLLILLILRKRIYCLELTAFITIGDDVYIG